MVAPIARNAINQPHIPFAERHLHSLRHCADRAPSPPATSALRLEQEAIDGNQKKNERKSRAGEGHAHTLLLLERALPETCSAGAASRLRCAPSARAGTSFELCMRQRAPLPAGAERSCGA